MSTRRLICLTALLFTFLAVSFTATRKAYAQEVTATILGTVTDPSGAPIKNATVTATDSQRGTVWTGQTNDSGAYNLTRLPVGTYTMKVEATGFDTVAHPAFTLVMNQTARVDVGMKVGSVSQTVEVTGAAPVLQTETTQVSTIIDSKTNTDLPLATRNYVQLTLLAPGSVTPDPDSFNNGDNTASGARPYINGNREQANNFILDGMDNNQVSDNLLGYTPAPDAIQEFNLITNNASAEFGNFQGGIVSTSIKSGTNGFHGDVWEFFRNDKLNSNQWENGFKGINQDGTPLPKPQLRWNMFGGTIGGPIVKDKLFFFFDYQGQRFDHPSTTQTLTVFTAAERGGNFGDLCTAGFTAGGLCNDTSQQLYDPFKNNAPYANNIITETVDPVAANLFKSSLYPAATGTNPYVPNASYTQTSLFDNNQYDIKIDANATSKDHLSARYSHSKQHNPTINSLAIIGTGFSDAPIDNIVGDWSHTFSSSFLNDLRLGVNHVKLFNGTDFASSVGDLGNQLGIGNGNPAGIAGLLSLGFNTNLTSIGNIGVQQKFDDAVIQASDAVVISRGRHVFHTGFEFWRNRINTFYTGNNGALGSINFNGSFTNCNPAGAQTPPASCPSGTAAGGGVGGYGGADFFLGLPINYGRGISGGEWGQRQSVFGAYLQDDYRVTNHLTLNLGLRYEAHTPWVEEHDRQVNFDLFSGQLVAPNCSRVTPLLGTAPVTCKQGSRGLYDGTYGAKDFQPRVGFAWTPASLDGKTVVRGAYTISSYMEGTGTNLRLPINAPFTTAETFVNYAGDAISPTTTDQGLLPVGSASDPFAGSLVRVWDPHVQPALTQQWNLTVQQQVFNQGTFQIGYVGQHGTHLMVPMPYLQKQFLAGTTCMVGTPPVAQTCTAPSIYFSGNPTFQSDISQISGTASVGEMKYDALQAVFQKRYGEGLEYQVAYTYSKCMTDNSGYYGTWGDTSSTPANPYYQNLYNPRADYAPCYFDAKHILSAYSVYELPFGHGKRLGHDMNPVANAVLGGWSVSPIVSLHTGFPLALYSNSDNSFTGSRGARLNCAAGAGGNLGRTPDIQGGQFVGYQWFDPSPYSEPSNVQGFGNCPAQGPVRGPGYFNTDLGILKNFAITESVHLQFRGDFLNAFNHTNLQAPATSWSAPGQGMGLVSGSQNARNIQFALKLYY